MNVEGVVAVCGVAFCVAGGGAEGVVADGIEGAGDFAVFGADESGGEVDEAPGVGSFALCSFEGDVDGVADFVGEGSFLVVDDDELFDGHDSLSSVEAFGGGDGVSDADDDVTVLVASVGGEEDSDGVPLLN